MGEPSLAMIAKAAKVRNDRISRPLSCPALLACFTCLARNSPACPPEYSAPHFVSQLTASTAPPTLVPGG